MNCILSIFADYFVQSGQILSSNDFLAILELGSLDSTVDIVNDKRRLHLPHTLPPRNLDTVH